MKNFTKKKIGILTQPLHDNYGGLLQAYALKEFIESLGHEVVIINRRTSKLRIYLSTLKKKIKGQKVNPKELLSSREKNIISQNTLYFRKKYIPNLSKLLTNDRQMKNLNKLSFDAYVVGSDQSWRPGYSPSIRNYFLDFIEKGKNVKRITYAVSFGVSHWEFSEKDTVACAFLAKKFDAISVREDSGVGLVKDFLGTESIHLVDPTMLLTKEHYQDIIEQESAKDSDGNLKVYILDRTEEKSLFITKLESILNLKHFQVMPDKLLGKDKMTNVNEFIYPNPANWLKGYEDAKFVVTDSFHGTVFAILFNIPFITLGNVRRGMARFESLLKMFDLEDRLVRNINDKNVNNIITNKINWDMVNVRLEEERKKAQLFLKDNLK